jgi:hypothetical protein
MQRNCWTLAILLTAALGAGSAQANDSLRIDLNGAAKKIHKILEGRSVDKVAVQSIAGEEGQGYGPGIQNLLIEELSALKVRVDSDADIRIQGAFRKGFVKDPSAPNDVILVKIDFHLYDRSGDEISEIPLKLEIRRNADIAKILGVSGGISGNGDYNQRNKDVADNLKTKPEQVRGTKVYAFEGSPYAVEILVKPNVTATATPREPRRDEKGEVFVDIQRGELYEVRFHNGSPMEAGVTLAIDGLDSFTFSELRDPKTGGPKYSRWVVGAGSTSTVIGWHKRDEAPDNFLSFLVTKYGEGASRKTPIPQASGKIGIITVAFAQAWTGEKPANERSADGGNETGFGPPVSQQVRSVQRQFGVERAVVNIRYARPQ